MVSTSMTGARRATSRLEIAAVGGIGLLLGIVVLGTTSLPQSVRPMVIAAIAVPLLAAMIGHIRHLLLGTIVLDTAFQWDANLSYDSAAASLGALGGINVSVTTIALGILYAMWIARALTERNAPGLRVRPALPFISYVAIVGLSATWAERSDLALNELWLLIQMAALLLYIVGTFRSLHDVRIVVTTAVVALLLESILVLLVFYFGRGIDFAGLTTHSSNLSGRETRPSGTLGSPNLAGGYLAVLLPLVAAALLADIGARIRMIARLAIGLGVIALIATQSRGAWVGFAGAVAVITVVAVQRRWLSRRIVARLGIVAIVLFLVAGGIVSSRLGGDDDGAAASRLPLMHLASDMIRDAPLAGVGSNNFSEKIESYAGPEFSGQFLYAVHNKYLLVWAETGIIGLFCYLLFLGMGLRVGWLCAKTSDRFAAPIAIGIIASIAGHMIHMNFDVFRGRPMIQTLIILTGSLISLRTVLSEERTVEAVPRLRLVGSSAGSWS